MNCHLPPRRCPWCGHDPLYVAYHDQEWGVPERGARSLFAKLLLDGFQAGLSWLTILRRREGILAAMEGLAPEGLARLGAKDQIRLLGDPRIIRSPPKVAAAVTNARAFLRMAERGVDFGAWLWAFVDGRPRQARRRWPSDVPTLTRQSHAMSRALRAEGFAYVGPTICYAFMQATGMVNDHLLTCFRREPVRTLAALPPHRA